MSKKLTPKKTMKKRGEKIIEKHEPKLALKSDVEFDDLISLSLRPRVFDTPSAPKKPRKK